jgi:glyoxylase-like metal-dependent hydrolase (beta-lactamase superfamily II)
LNNIAGYTFYEIDAGRLALDGGAMFGIVPRTLWERQIKPDEKHRIPLATRCLLIEGNGRLILVDNGVGDKQDAKFAGIYGLDFVENDLHRALKSHGFSAFDVTDVILTHLHFDHCGGSTTRDGDRLRTTFPNAVYHVQERHWAWAHESPREQASFIRENLEPLADSGQLSLVRGDQTLFPGVDVLTVDGHTRGQQMVKVSGEEGALLFAADLLPTAAHVPLLWIMAYDVAPLETLEEKRRILEQAAGEDWLVVFEHDVRYAAGRIRQSERGFEAVELAVTLREA